MIKQWPLPKNFSGRKFAKRYGLKNDIVNPDFWADDKYLYILKNLPDDPPIFEANDPPKPPKKERIKNAKTLEELKDVLLED